MAEYHIIQEKPYDILAYERLAAAIIRQAYEDYIECRKRCESIRDPSASHNATRMLERIMAQEVSLRMGCGMKKAMKHLDWLEPDFIKTAHSMAVTQGETIIKFFFSDSFTYLSRGMDPCCLIERAENEIRAWKAGRKTKNEVKARKDGVPG